MGTFTQKTDYLIETKGLLKDRINSLGGSITSGTTFRDYLVWLDSLYEALEEKTITGLPDSLEGKCEQTTTQTGKNLFNTTLKQGAYSFTTGNWFNTTLYVCTTDKIDVVAGQTYTLSFKGNSNNYRGMGFVYFNDNTYKGYSTLDRNTITIPSDVNKVHFNIYNPNGITPSDVYEIQLEKGSQATSYEPYIPNSPSPDYPQPINVTTGRQVVSVCGKNLLPNNATTQTINDITFTINSDKSITTSGTATAQTDFYLVGGASQYIDLGLPSGNYKLSGVSNGALNTYMLYCVQNRNGTLSYYQNINSQGTTINIQSGDTFRFFIRVLNGKSVNETIKPMLEVGTTATTYEEYKGNDYEINLGKNLYYMNYNDVTNSNWNGVDITSTTTGYSVSGTCSSNASFTLVNRYITLPAGTYTMVLENPNTMRVGLSKTNYANLFIMSIGSQKETFTLSEETKVCLTISIVNGTTYNETNNIMIEKGSVATSYSPYKTPIYLGKIGTYQDRIFKSSGKNLFKGALYNGIINQGGTYISNVNRITNADSSTMKTFILKKGTYTLSIANIDACTIVIKNESGSLIQEFADSWKTLPYTFTTTNDGYFYFSARKNIDSALTPSDYKPMLNEGSTALQYEPYGKDWYLNKQIGKVVYDGSDDEAWSYLNNYDDNYLYQSLGISVDIENYSTNYLCSHALPNSTSSSSGNIGSYVFNKAFRLRVPSSIATTTGAFKTWLSSNNVELYYILNTPTNTLIEDEELINQLNEIEIFTVISEDFYN